MARGLRLVSNESGVVEVSARTLQGRFLMRPSALVNAIILGIMGRAQRLTGVEIFAFIFMSNHYHILMRVESAQQMARFMEYLNGNIARKLGLKFKWRERFWGRRYHSACVGDSAEAQMARFRYLIANGCKEGLVASPLEWPGVTSARALARGQDTMEGTWYDRTAEYNEYQRTGVRKLFPSTETVRLTPLPFLAERSMDERRQFVRSLIREVEEETAAIHKKANTVPLGARAIRRQKPQDRPKEFHPSPAPRFHAATREELWIMRYARDVVVKAYRAAAERLRRGEKDVQFPEGCFPPPLPFVESRAPT